MRAVTLPRYTMNTGLLLTAAVVASSPLVVLTGGIPVMVGQLGVIGVPLAFVVVMLVLRLIITPYVTVGRYVVHGAPFYAQLTRGWNPTAGLGGASWVLLGYSALQISLFGLFGATASGLFGGPWWLWAAGFGIVVFWLAQYPGHRIARRLSVLLALEVVVIALFTVSGFTHPAEGRISLVVWEPSRLLVPSAVTGVIVFTVACFTGIETILTWGEEATAYRALARAANVAVWCCGLGYAAVTWAYITWIGPHHLGEATTQAGQPLALLGGMFGAAIADLATMLLLTSILAAAVSFHCAIARYVLAMAREGVLPSRWSTISRGAEGGAPLGGSAVQAVIAVVVIGGFLIGGADPMTMFTWLSAIGAVCVVLLLTAACWSTTGFYERGLGGDESVMVRAVAPFAGGIAGLLTAIFMSANLTTLLGTPAGSRLPWLVPAVIVAAALIAVVGGTWLRLRRPEVYEGISYGVPDQAVVGDDQLGALEI